PLALAEGLDDVLVRGLEGLLALAAPPREDLLVVVALDRLGLQLDRPLDDRAGVGALGDEVSGEDEAVARGRVLAALEQRVELVDAAVYVSDNDGAAHAAEDKSLPAGKPQRPALALV